MCDTPLLYKKKNLFSHGRDSESQEWTFVALNNPLTIFGIFCIFGMLEWLSPVHVWIKKKKVCIYLYIYFLWMSYNWGLYLLSSTLFSKIYSWTMIIYHKFTMIIITFSLFRSACVYFLNHFQNNYYLTLWLTVPITGVLF